MASDLLSGITVLDLTRVMSGPYCTLMLADMGARVVKIEHPRRGDDTRAWGPPFIRGESVYFLSVNRNKESLTLDFKEPDGRRILERLLDRADVFVENFRPGTLARAGLDYASLAPRFPRLVYASISGYGQTGPSAGLAGYDAVAQAEGGLMSVTGDVHGAPFRLGLPVVDLVSGLLAAQGVLAALYARHATGRGRQIDISMLETAAGLLTYQAANYLATGENPPRMGNAHASIVPYGTFEVSDGSLMLAVGNDDQWRRFCAAAGLKALLDDERFSTNPSRVTHRDEVLSAIAPVLRTRTRADWTGRLRAAGVPCGAVHSVGEALANPQLIARGMVETLHHPVAGDVRVVANPVRVSDGTRTPDLPPPRLGEHTETILSEEIGLTTEDIADLRGRGIV